MNNGKRKNFSIVQKHVGKYESMLQKQVSYYFDIGEFEIIIDYFLENGKMLDAENALNYAFKLHPNAVSFQLKSAHILINKGNIVEAYQLLLKLKKIQPEEPEIYFLLGFIAILNKNKEEAEEYFNIFINLSSKDEKSFSSVAFVFQKNGYYDFAIKYLLKAYSKNKTNQYVLYDLAYSYEKIGNLEKSSTFYLKFLEENPFSSNAWYNYGIICENLGKHDKAVDAYDFAIAIKPKFSSAYLNKAAVLSNTNLNEDAIYVLKEFLTIEPNNIIAFSRIGECYRRIGNNNKAMSFFKKALEIDKYYADSLYGVASIYYLNGDYFEGLNYIIRALKTNDKNSDYYYLQAQFFIQLEHTDKAEISILNSIKYNVTNAKKWLLYADLLFDTNKHKTIDILIQASEIIPQNAEINYILSALYFHIEDEEIANEFFKKASEIDYNLFNDLINYFPKGFSRDKIIPKIENNF